MTYEHRPGGYPASPNVDDGLPEICEICNRDCSDPCEALKIVVAVKNHLTTWRSGHSDWQMGRMTQWKKELEKILEGEV